MKKRSTRMALGPLEYLVIGFEGNRFTGQILPELRAARDNGIIRAIDLKEAIKHASGIVVAGGLVAPDVLQELEEELQASQQPAGQDQAAVKAAQ
jgi:hypothetical protein